MPGCPAVLHRPEQPPTPFGVLRSSDGKLRGHRNDGFTTAKLNLVACLRASDGRQNLELVLSVPQGGALSFHSGRFLCRLVGFRQSLRRPCCSPPNIRSTHHARPRATLRAQANHHKRRRTRPLPWGMRNARMRFLLLAATPLLGHGKAPSDRRQTGPTDFARRKSRKSPAIKQEPARLACG